MIDSDVAIVLKDNDQIDFISKYEEESAPFGLPMNVASSIAVPDVEQFGLSVRTLSQTNDPGFSRSDATLELVIGRSNFLPSWFAYVGDQRQKAVCLISTQGTNYLGETGRWRGSAFLVSENILLTNHHVLNSQQVAENASAIFNFQANQLGNDLPTVLFRLRPDLLFLTDNKLDFTFVAVEGEPGCQFGCIQMSRAFFNVSDGEYCNVIQHPGGEKKVFVLQENRVKKQTPATLLYTSDTMPGSSGSPVFNNDWNLVALHHASREVPESGYKALNEGIKISAIAVALEGLVNDPGKRSAAQSILSLFTGSNSITGYFGTMGRNVDIGETGEELVVNSYKGDDEDIDVGFWNIEHFERTYTEKLPRIAELIIDLNLDVWAFEEVSPRSVDLLVEYLSSSYQMDFDYCMSEPNAPDGKQSTGVIWNKASVKCSREEWPPKVKEWLSAHSRDFNGIEDGFEAVDGQIFNRYPERFFVETLKSNRLQFYLVPLHLKAMPEGSKRRKMASEILSGAVSYSDKNGGRTKNWLIGGDMNATLSSKDFSFLEGAGLVAMSADDEKNGAITYIGRPKSLIDHIFLSPNLISSTDASFFVVARDKEIPRFTREISDHRPVLVRLSAPSGNVVSSNDDFSKTLDDIRATIDLF